MTPELLEARRRGGRRGAATRAAKYTHEQLSQWSLMGVRARGLEPTADCFRRLEELKKKEGLKQGQKVNVFPRT